MGVYRGRGNIRQSNTHEDDFKIKKVYDVSAVSIPANGDTEISARNFAHRSYEAERQELLNRRVALLKIRANL